MGAAENPSEWAHRHRSFDRTPPRWSPDYVPTAGMLRALCGDEHATELDFDRCRLRGLIDRERWPTKAGQEVIAAEIARRKVVAGG